jgi:hypothetical protein
MHYRKKLRLIQKENPTFYENEKEHLSGYSVKHKQSIQHLFINLYRFLI